MVDRLIHMNRFGEIIHLEVIRDQKTGKSKGFAFLQYEDQRSTILAVDNLNGAQVLGRTLRVDHSHTGPRKPKKKEEEEEEDDDQPKMNVAPQYIEGNCFLFISIFTLLHIL